jgi:hypothetical protein
MLAAAIVPAAPLPAAADAADTAAAAADAPAAGKDRLAGKRSTAQVPKGASAEMGTQPKGPQALRT